MVITPEEFLARFEERVNDILSLRVVTFAIGVVTTALNDTITSAYTTSVTWVAQTAAAQWITTQYLETELFVTNIFSKEKADKLRIELENRAKNAVKNPS